MKYGSTVLILQAISLILLERLPLLFYPRWTQKLERFYKSVVEEALLGKVSFRLILPQDYAGP